MHILYLNGHPFWTNQLLKGFEELGHEVSIVDAIHKESLKKHIEGFKPDLMMTVGWMHEYIPEKQEIVRDLAKQHQLLHAYWATEDIQHFARWSLPYVKKVQPDVVFTINAECIPFYTEIGIPAYHLEFGYNPSVEDSLQDAPFPQYTHDLALVANAYDILENPNSFRYESANILIRPLLEKGYNLVIYGEGWSPAKKIGDWPLDLAKCPGPIEFKDSFKVFRSSKIILNLQNENRFSTQITSRTLDIPGCGGFQLTVDTPAVKELFRHRQHLLMSGSAAETLNLVDYYLDRPQERLAIAEKGRQEVLARHTTRQRAEYLLSCLEQLDLSLKSGLKDFRQNKSPQKGQNLKIIQPQLAVSIFSNQPYTPLSNQPFLYVGREMDNSFKWLTAQSFLHFDLKDLPLEAEIDSAFLYLWPNEKSAAGQHIGCYPVLLPWTADRIDVTAQTINPTQLVDLVEISKNTHPHWLFWNVTSLVKQWQNQKLPNYGLCLRSLNDLILRSAIQAFASPNNAEPENNQPYLLILYSLSPQFDSQKKLDNICSNKLPRFIRKGRN